VPPLGGQRRVPGRSDGRNDPRNAKSGEPEGLPDLAPPDYEYGQPAVKALEARKIAKSVKKLRQALAPACWFFFVARLAASSFRRARLPRTTVAP
jgi:hypothetical protein